MIKYLLSFFLICFPAPVFLQAQVLMNKDSLLRLLPQAKEDTAAVHLLINIGQQYEGNQPELAKQYYRQSLQLSRKIGYRLGEIKFAANYTYLLNMQGLYDSSILINRHSVDLARIEKDREYLGKCLFNTGTAFQYAGEYDSAIIYYEEGKTIFGELGNEMLVARSKDILQLLYMSLHRYDEAIALGESALMYFRNSGDLYTQAMILNNTALSYTHKRNFPKALRNFEEVLRNGRELGDLHLQATALINIGDVYMQTNRFSEIRPFFEQSLRLAKSLDNRETEAIANRGLAIYFLWKNDLKTAEDFIKISLEITRSNNQVVQYQKSLETYSNILFAQHRVLEAEEVLRTGTRIADSLIGERIQHSTLSLEKKYQSERKDNQIRLQQASLKQKTTWNYLLIGGAIALLVISALLFLNYRQKQRWQAQRIQELETEKQLMAAEAVLKGEEQERSRLAKDLHDGLGGMLSGIKYSLNTMKGNLIMTPENQQAFERSMDMLDSSIREMRRVAHNMMPEALVKFGLDTALKDFCNDINQSGALAVTYQSFGVDNRDWDHSIAITIYRIVQELLNNTMKHAGAKTALVQISHTDEGTTITVEDDGKGFDPAILQIEKGIGWSNIQSRIHYLKGRWDIQSEPGKGTSIHIEINA